MHRFIDGPPRIPGGLSNGVTMDDFISPPEPVQAVAAQRPAPMPWARVGLLGIAVAALIAAAILAFGPTASPSGILAATTTGSGDGSGVVLDLHGGGPGFGHGFGGITITNISGNSISLETADGWTRTITVDTGTIYSKSGDTIALGDLKVGDEIGFRQTLESNGTYTIDSIAVILPHVGGEVTAVDGSTITVKQRDGSTATIKVTSSTTYNVAGADAKLADLKVGMFLVAEGTKNADGSLTASDVHAGSAGDRGPGRGGFHMGFGPDWDGDQPQATAGSN
jgi:hypothetical protein